MISWKHSFRKFNEEYQTAKRKKQALDKLLDSGKISKSTHDLFNKEIAEAITEIENQQKSLVQKMNMKTMELSEQIKTLEVLLANSEIQHVTGEVEDEIYEREAKVLSTGLEAAKRELLSVKDAVDQLSNGAVDNVEPLMAEAEPQELEKRARESQSSDPAKGEEKQEA